MSHLLPSSRSPQGHSSDLERLWRALMTTSWQCLVVIPAGPSTSVDSVLDALQLVLAPDGSDTTEILDGRSASMGDGDLLARQVVDGGSTGRRVVAFIDPITQSLAGVPLVRAADSVLLIVQIDSSDVESLSSTLSIVGADRVVGAVAVSASS